MLLQALSGRQNESKTKKFLSASGTALSRQLIPSRRVPNYRFDDPRVGNTTTSSRDRLYKYFGLNASVERNGGTKGHQKESCAMTS